jgi:hypothetical protein
MHDCEEKLMSPLAFDKQGKPFSFLRRTKKLLVRLFRNPAARGTCCQVLGSDGQPLYVDSETDCLEFRRAVGHVPGLYRLDQCDEDGNELDDAPPAYVSIEVARNAQSADIATGEVSPLVIIQQMAAVQADVMKTMAAQQGAVLAAAAEILRAPYRPAPVVATVTELRNAEVSGADNEEDDDEIEEETTPEHPGMAFLRMMQPYFPEMGAALYQKCADLLRGKKNPPAPVTTAAPASPIAPQPVAAPTQTDIGSSRATDDDVVDTSAPIATAAPSGETAIVEDAAGVLPSDVIAPEGTTNAASAMSSMPTPEQFLHLHAIREQLTDQERALVENVIARMEPQMRSHWIAKLSAMSVNDATALIRTMAAEGRAPRGSKR